METPLGLGVVQTWALDRHSLDQLVVRFVESQRRRHLGDGSEDLRRRRGSARRPVLPVRQVVLRPGIPEFDHGIGGVVIDRPRERERAAFARGDQRLAQGDRPRGFIHVDDGGAFLDGIVYLGRRAALDAVAFTQEGDLFALVGVQMEDHASRWIRSAPRPPDGRRDRQGAAAREHVFVVLPLSVAIAGRDRLERALRKDVGAGRDLDGRVRVVGGVGDVVKGPAFFAEILSQELVVLDGEFLDVGLQKLDRVDSSGPAVNIGIRPRTPASPVGSRSSPGSLGHHPDVVRRHRQRQIDVIDIGDIVIDQGDQLVVRNFIVGFRRDLRIDQVAVVANRPLRELVFGIVIGSLGDLGSIPHHDAVRDRVATGLRSGDGAVPLGIPSQGIWESARRQVLAIGSNADAGAIPEDQRNAHENALAGFQAEVVFSTLLVADVAAVFFVGRIVGIIQAGRSAPLEGIRVGIPHDRIDGLRGVVRDPQGLQGDGVAVRVDTIRQKLPG